MKSILTKIKTNIPLLLIVFVASLITLQNTSAKGYYSGWDNIHAEMNLSQYAKRVFYGAWQEHQGLGGPAAKGHLAEVTRIPYLYVLTQVFPEHLVRASFLFSMYLIGGVSMYFYVKKYWLEDKKSINKSWLAGAAGLLYLLHPLTLQQFYISFELFTVQFAFFPLVLISIHLLADNINKKTILFFIAMQLAIASSGHTPTVFYFGALFTAFYAIALHFKKHKKLIKSIQFSVIIGLLTLLVHSFWVIPNLYYSFHNSQYVTESKANIVFGPEALWSIREASTLQSFMTGYHYITGWKDYNFGSQQHELIFNEWKNVFTNPFRNLQLYVISGFAIFGIIASFLQLKKQPHKSVIAVLFMFTSAFIWIELFPTKYLLLELYKSKTFLEIFRNPFTKLSILHSIFLVLLAIESLNFISKLLKKHLSKKLAYFLSALFIGMGVIYSLSITPESIKGHFINEKLRVVFPTEYEQLFAFLETQDHSSRILEMPYTSREGWVLYDWSNQGKINGYQGLGFYFFGFPQPFLTSDFARWSGVNDYFYEELTYAVNSSNPQEFEKIATKYLVPLVVLDESRIQPYQKHDFNFDKKLLIDAGFKEIWNENFITIYEHPQIKEISADIIIPKTIAKTSVDTARVSVDPVYEKFSEYAVMPQTENDSSTIQFPFSTTQKSELHNQVITQTEAVLSQKISKQRYSVNIPGISASETTTVVAIQKLDDTLSFFFPQYSLKTEQESHPINSIPNFEIELEESNEKISEIKINGVEIPFSNSEYTYAEISIDAFSNIIVTDIENTQLASISVPWEELIKEQTLSISDTDEINFVSTFPNHLADLTKQPSENCVTPKRGTIKTTYSDNGSTTYTANNFGVNCNSVNIPFISPNVEYITSITGKNLAGRSIKLFIHYSKPNTTPTEYILPEKQFSVSYPLKNLNMGAETKLYFNWESRSFGKYTENVINSFVLAPFDISRASQLTLTPNDLDTTQAIIDNTATIIDSKKHSTSRYSVNLECESECYFGINQAFDDLWVAYDTQTKSFLPHVRYNNWANLWTTKEGSHTVIIFYIPQYLAFISLGILIGFIGLVLIQKSKNKKMEPSQKKDLLNKTLKETAKNIISKRMLGK